MHLSKKGALMISFVAANLSLYGSMIVLIAFVFLPSSAGSFLGIGTTP